MPEIDDSIERGLRLNRVVEDVATLVAEGIQDGSDEVSVGDLIQVFTARGLGDVMRKRFDSILSERARKYWESILKSGGSDGSQG